MSTVNRRGFLRDSSLLATAALVAPSLAGLVACSQRPGILSPRRNARLAGYGPLQPYRELPEISLPAGFHAVKLSESGRPMSDGTITPQAFDGMGAFGAGGDRVRLVRNHEIRNLATDINAGPLWGSHRYDSLAPAGTTTLEVDVHSDGSAELRREFVSLAGTYVNCAGGQTPWGSWITCEETVAGPSVGWRQNHGYNFEVPAMADAPVTPVPLRDMGRFVHEAIAVDPATGIVYETEDSNSAGFYRFIPRVKGDLASGGMLEMLAVDDQPGFDTRTGQTVGMTYAVNWVPIAQPDTDDPAALPTFVSAQGFALGGAHFARLEGCWYGDSGIYFNSTSGGDVEAGQIWKYTPKGLNAGELALVFESPGVDVLNSPDNICVSPRGGVVICEDGGVANFVRGISREGVLFDLVRNNANTAEWAGACFSPRGRTLFVNVQGSTLAENRERPSVTYAIWGPWEEGAL